MLRDGFQQLLEILRQKKSKGATWRNLLAHHTSECCAPGHSRGSVGSLKEAGIDDDHTTTTGEHVCKLKLMKLFEAAAGSAVPADLPPFECTSSGCATQAEAQEEACFFTLAFLLCTGPALVFLHPNSLSNAVQTVRDAARPVHSAMLEDPSVSGIFSAWSTWAQQPDAVLAPNVTIAAPKTKLQADPSKALSPEELVDVLRKAGKNGNPLNPSHLPVHVRSVLANTLKKGELKPFLKERQDVFTIQQEKGCNQWTFSVNEVGNIQASSSASRGAASPSGDPPPPQQPEAVSSSSSGAPPPLPPPPQPQPVSSSLSSGAPQPQQPQPPPANNSSILNTEEWRPWRESQAAHAAKWASQQSPSGELPPAAKPSPPQAPPEAAAEPAPLVSQPAAVVHTASPASSGTPQPPLQAQSASPLPSGAPPPRQQSQVGSSSGSGAPQPPPQPPRENNGSTQPDAWAGYGWHWQQHGSGTNSWQGTWNWQTGTWERQ